MEDIVTSGQQFQPANFSVFKSHGLSLRKMGRADQIRLLANKCETIPYVHTSVFLNEEDQLSWYDRASKSNVDLILIASGIKESGDVWQASDDVGVFKIQRINWINRCAEIGWDVFSIHRGQGHGKDLVKAGIDFCFSVLNMNRVECEILDFNEASIACAVKAGMDEEGTKAKSVFKNGEYHNSHIYSMLKDEFDPDL